MVTMQVLPNREVWLKHRTKIGGSDASAILGKNPYKTNVELWKDKAFHLMPEDISDKPYVKYGIQAEPHLRALFSLDFPEKKFSTKKTICGQMTNIHLHMQVLMDGLKIQMGKKEF